MFTSEILRWIAGDELLQMPGVPTLVLQHLAYSFIPLVLAIAVALPLGVWVGHTGRGGTLAINASNVGRAVPSFGIIVIAYIASGRGVIPVFVTLVAMAIPPIVTNAYVGVRQVDPEVRDAARGMGLTAWQLVRQVELPMAMPIIMAGIRTSAVQVVATATLAAYIGLEGLGRPIFTGLATGVQFNTLARAVVLVGIIGVAILAIATEQGLGWLERRIVPQGIQAKAAAEAGPAAVIDSEAEEPEPAHT